MAQHKLTAKFIETLPDAPTGSSRTYYDTEARGLALRVTGTGYKSFLFCYGFQGREYRMPLAEYVPGCKALDKAREKATELRAQVKAGSNPYAEVAQKRITDRDERRAERERIEREAAERIAAEEAEQAKLTFDQLTAVYEKKHARHKRSHKATMQRIRRYLTPVWGDRKVESLGKVDAKKILEPIRAAGKKAELQHVRSLISGIFSFAIGEDLYDAENPCSKLKKQDNDALDPRERALETPQELRLLWALTDTARRARLAPDVAEGLRFMLLTGCRPGEAGGLRWSELDLDAATWTKPRNVVGRSKTKRPDVIPLMPPLVAMLRARQGNGSPYVWPSGRSRRRANGGGAGYLTPAKLAAGLRDVRPLMERLGIEVFKPHDIRATVATGLGKLLVPPHIIEGVLNHAKKGVTNKHYMMYQYLPEKREALERWLAFLDTVVAGDQKPATVASIERMAA